MQLKLLEIRQVLCRHLPPYQHDMARSTCIGITRQSMLNVILWGRLRCCVMKMRVELVAPSRCAPWSSTGMWLKLKLHRPVRDATRRKPEDVRSWQPLKSMAVGAGASVLSCFQRPIRHPVAPEQRDFLHRSQ